MKFQLIMRCRRIGIRPGRIVRALKRLKFKKGIDDSRVNIVLTDDREIADLNRRFLKRNCATDVLAFPTNDEEGNLLGEVVISVDAAKRQALQRDVALHDELILLSLHGLLHLTGQRDDTLKNYCEMRRLEFENLVEML